MAYVSQQKYKWTPVDQSKTLRNERTRYVETSSAQAKRGRGVNSHRSKGTTHPATAPRLRNKRAPVSGERRQKARGGSAVAIRRGAATALGEKRDRNGVPASTISKFLFPLSSSFLGQVYVVWVDGMSLVDLLARHGLPAN
jgi:hypothetical protein